MKHIYYNIYNFFYQIKNNIAFYPTVLATLGFLFSLIMIVLEKQGISKYLLDILPILVVENGDTALNILSVCIGGLISMMVFSFSMVMLLLSQASSNFSPRLLPGLISDKRHQMILGFYLASIMYNIFTMFSIQPTGEKYTLPGFSVLLGILFTIFCLCSFIYFIHNISQSIQISNILDDIYEKAKQRLEHIIEKEAEMDIDSTIFDNTENWNPYTSPKSGYFQTLSINNVVQFCKDNETKLIITIPKGLFVLKNKTFIKSDKKLNKEQIEDLLDNFNFSKNELVEENYSLAFKQITEIAVKAMSPGINDPGTAINAIDYLTEMFALRMKKKDSEILTDDAKDTAYFKLSVVSFENLTYNVMASLRTYCKHDPIIVHKLLWMLDYLRDQPAKEKTYKSVIEEQIKILIKDSEAVLGTQKDKELLTEFISVK